MIKYTEQELKVKYDQFIQILKDEFKGNRLKKLLKLYDESEYGYNLILAPASPKEHFHLAYVGGYLDHILNVYETSKLMQRLYEHRKGVVDWTTEELVFSAIHHDLGKLGYPETPYYVDQESDWHRKNQGAMFKLNPELQYMNVTDRALYILQKYDIKVTDKEYLSIKLSDGLYDEANAPYLKTYQKEFKLKFGLPYIIHWADHMSTQIEYDSFMK